MRITAAPGTVRELGHRRAVRFDREDLVGIARVVVVGDETIATGESRLSWGTDAADDSNATVSAATLIAPSPSVAW